MQNQRTRKILQRIRDYQEEIHRLTKGDRLGAHSINSEDLNCTVKRAKGVSNERPKAS